MKLVIQSNARIWGGNEKWLLLVGEGLAARGHDVIVSCRPDGEVHRRAVVKGLRVTHRRPGGDADLPRGIGFMRMLQHERPDAVLLTALKRVLWGGWAAKRAGAPRVIERLGIEHDLPNSWKYRHAFRNYIDGLIVNSDAIRQRWLDSAPWFPPGEVHVVLNGVRPTAPREQTVRQQLGVGPSALVIAAAGRLEHRKGFDLLIEAFALSGLEDAHLLIAGDGADQARLRAQAERLGVAGRTHWLGFVQDLDHVLLGADLFVLPSRNEGMANVMLEAMAAGCLVVAADISGVRQAIGEVEGRPAVGWIVPPDDAEQLAKALGSAGRAMQAADPTVQSMKREARYRVEHWFSPERTVAQTEAVLFPTAAGARA